MKKACVIIPIYNVSPTANEIISIKRNTSVLNDYDIFAIHPDSMDVAAYKDYAFTAFISFNDKYFRSNKSYSRLILSEDFYLPFQDYEYMLIAQTDTCILNTSYTLMDFMNKGYDYWGAPWPEGPFDKPYGIREYFKCLFIHNPENLHVGNGGFSLRKVKTTYELVKNHPLYIKYIWKFNEDMFFSLFARKGGDKKTNYTAATADEAKLFALETNMSDEINKGSCPYAIHAWEKYYKGDISNLMQ